jgi:hypothetical protein
MKAVTLIALLTLGFFGCTVPTSKLEVEKGRLICHYYTRVVEMPYAAGCCIDWFSNIMVDHKPMMRNDTLSFYIKQNIGFYEHYTPEKGFLLEWFPEYRQLMNH